MIFQQAAVAFWLFASSGHIISLSNSQIWKFMVQGFSLIESIWPIGLHRLRLKATICHRSTPLFHRSRGVPFRPWRWRMPRCCARCPGSSCVASCASRWARSRLRRWRLPSVGCRPLGVGRGWKMADIFGMFAVFEILCKNFVFSAGNFCQICDLYIKSLDDLWEIFGGYSRGCTWAWLGGC